MPETRPYPFRKAIVRVHGIVALLLLALSFSPSAEELKVKGIHFTGDSVFTPGQLRGLMETKTSYFWRKSIYSRAKLEADLSVIAGAYQQKGYLAAEAKIDSVVPDTARKSISLYLTVSEGPQTMVDSVAVTGASVLSPDSELVRLQTKPDAPFSRNAVDQDAQKIVGDLAKRGYLYGHVDDSSSIDTVAHRASVVFTIDQGPLVFAGAFNVGGLKKVRSVVVTRELRFKPGDTLTTKKIDLTVQKLYGTSLFNFMQFKVPQENFTAEERKLDTVTEPVTATAEEARFFSIDAALGYGTYDLFRGSAETRYGNLFGLGHAVTFDGIYNHYELRGAATYSYPWIFSLPVDASFSAYIEHHDITYRGLFDGIQLSVAKETDWNVSYRVWLKLERVEYLYLIPGQDTTGTLSHANTQSIGTDFYYDTRKNLSDTTSGLFVQYSPELAGLGGRGTNQYYRMLIDVRGFMTEFRDFRFSSALQLGFAKGYGASGDSVPAQVIYNIGIDALRPVRGYGQNELSPGGGRLALIVNLLQAQRLVYKWFGLSAFLDAGYAWADPPHHVFLGDLRWVLGPGVYAKTPLGQVELDWGYRLSHGPKWGTPYFSVGQTF